ncbi:MAG TPA: addiction module protein [Vicinamibacteria bacterium]|nr:addiction module protein [Vicinamibacteria bacterium]
MLPGNAMDESPIRIESLSTDERLNLLERLWDSLSTTPADVPVTPAQRAELDRRSDALGRDGAEGHALGVPWDEVVRQLRARR